MQKLTELKKKIESMDKEHHVKILEIIQDNKITYSENKNGIFINLNNMKPDVIEKIKDYINYTNCQETNLQNMETKKKELEKQFFKDNKEKTASISNV
uniref:NET domain-containing protein n=1 Tax=viral metagenome TaxID=1070528 RepID=A0A6C0CR04_9ZZZZ